MRSSEDVFLNIKNTAIKMSISRVIGRMMTSQLERLRGLKGESMSELEL